MIKMEKKVYGIDLGTTYSAIATMNDDGMPEIIENDEDSSLLLPSAVYFSESGVPVVGKEAKNQAQIDNDKVVQCVKRFIGDEKAPKWTFNEVAYDPISISALILKRMKEYAEAQGHDVQDVVITCPAFFKIPHRNATRQAGQIAGLNVLNIINEPTAAALSYCFRDFRESKKIMVYDLGGGTFDVTLFDFDVDEETKKASVKVGRSAGDKKLGGVDWDERLFSYMCELYVEENGFSSQKDIEESDKLKIRGEVEETKKTLSSPGIAVKNVVIYGTNNNTTRIEVRREEFEKRSRDLVERTMNFVKSVMTKSSVTANDIDVVLLVGGSTKMLMIKNAVEELFPGKVRIDKPEYAVVLGATLAASIEVSDTDFKTDDDENQDDVGSDNDDTSGGSSQPDGSDRIAKGHIKKGDKEMVFDDVIPSSFGPAIFNEKEEYVIDNLLFVNDPSPAEVTQKYATMAANQPYVEISIFENMSENKENRYVKPCRNENGDEQSTDGPEVKFLDLLKLDLPPNTPKGSPIEVKFVCSTKGLDVYVSNPLTSDPPKHLSINLGGGKSEEEMEQEIQRFKHIRTSGQIQ
jgi:molecular chaperone DnaK (HSP70)